MHTPAQIALRRTEQRQRPPHPEPVQPPRPPDPPRPINPRVKLLVQELTAYPETYLDLTAPEIAALLNAAGSMENPAPQADLPALQSIVQAMTVINSKEALAIYQVGNGELKRDIEAVIASRNPEAMAAVFRIIAPMLSEESQKYLLELLAQTIPDPTWTPTVPTPSRAKQIGIGQTNAVEVIQAQEIVAKAA